MLTRSTWLSSVPADKARSDASCWAARPNTSSSMRRAQYSSSAAMNGHERDIWQFEPTGELQHEAYRFSVFRSARVSGHSWPLETDSLSARITEPVFTAGRAG